MRQLLFFSLFLAASAPAQDLNRPVTYRTVAIPVHRALEEISKQSGVRLYASQDLDDEPIILSLKGATTDEVMKQMASVIGGQWEKRDNNEFLLTRPAALKEKLSQAALETRAKTVQAGLDRLRSQLNLQKDPPERFAEATGQSLAAVARFYEEGKHDHQTLERLQARFPSQRALDRLLVMIPAVEIARLQDGEVVVYATHPNAMQRAFPEGADQVGDQLQQEQNLLAQAFAKAHPAKVSDIDGRIIRATWPMRDPPAKLIVRVEKEGYMDAPWATLMVVGPDGKAAGYANESLAALSLLETRGQQDALLAKSAKQPDIPLSPESKIVSATCHETSRRTGSPPLLTEEAKRLLLHPTVHDHLSFLISDGFLALADSEQTNLVACPNDNLILTNFAKEDSGFFKLPLFLDDVDRAGMTVETQGGWTLCKAVDPVAAKAHRTNRELFEQCLKEADEQGYISIATAAEMARSEESSSLLEYPSMMMLIDRKYAPFIERSKRVLLFYSTLSPSQLKYLSNGGVMPAASMTKEQWERAEEIAFLGGPSIGFEGPNIAEEGDMGTYALAREATEIMPDGLPQDTTVSMKEEATDILFVAIKVHDNVYCHEASPELIARYLATRQAPHDPDDWYASEVQWIAPGKSRNLFFEFKLTPTYKCHGQLREIVQSDEKWTLDKLPPDLKKKIDAAVVEARKKLDGQLAPAPAEPPSKPPIAQDR